MKGEKKILPNFITYSLLQYCMFSETQECVNRTDILCFFLIAFSSYKGHHAVTDSLQNMRRARILNHRDTSHHFNKTC